MFADDTVSFIVSLYKLSNAHNAKYPPPIILSLTDLQWHRFPLLSFRAFTLFIYTSTLSHLSLSISTRVAPGIVGLTRRSYSQGQEFLSQWLLFLCGKHFADHGCIHNVLQSRPSLLKFGVSWYTVNELIFSNSATAHPTLVILYLGITISSPSSSSSPPPPPILHHVFLLLLPLPLLHVLDGSEIHFLRVFEPPSKGETFRPEILRNCRASAVRRRAFQNARKDGMGWEERQGGFPRGSEEWEGYRQEAFQGGGLGRGSWLSMEG